MRIFILVLLLLPVISPAQDSLFTYVAKVDTGADEFHAIEIHDGIAYVASGITGLRVLDLTDPVEPVEIGCLETDGQAIDLEIVGDYVYLADGRAGFKIIDISSPEEPQLESSFTEIDTRNRKVIENVKVSDNIAFLEYTYDDDGWDTMLVIDVTDPAEPELISYIVDFLHIRCYEAVDSFLYIISGSYLNILDVSDPEDPEIAITIELEGSSYSILVEDSLLFISIYDFTNRSSFLIIYDVTDPYNPELLNEYETIFTPSVMRKEDNYLYVMSYGSGGILIIDISDPSAPQEVTMWFHENMDFFANKDMAISDDYVYITNERRAGLMVIDVSDPEEPLCGGIYKQGFVRRVTLKDDLAFIAAGTLGMLIYDIENLEEPSLIGVYDSPGEVKEVFVLENYAYIADGDSDLRVVDVSDPEALFEVGFLDTPGYSWDVLVRNEVAYLADSGGGVRFIDVSSPEAPEEIAVYEPADLAKELILDGDTLYVGCSYNDSHILDISDVENVEEISRIDSYSAFSIEKYGNYLTTGSGTRTTFYDITDITNPIEFCSYITGSGNGLVATHDYVFAAIMWEQTWYKGGTVKAFGLCDTVVAEPRARAWFFSENGLPIGVTSRGHYLFVANAFNFLILRNHLWTVQADFALAEPENNSIIQYETASDLILTWNSSFDPDSTDAVEYNIHIMSSDSLSESILVYREIEDTSITLDLLDSLDLLDMEDTLGFTWWVESITEFDTIECEERFSLLVEPEDGVKSNEEIELPERYEITALYPNPFNSQLTIKVSLPIASTLQIRVYNILGEEVAILSNGSQNAGIKSFVLEDGSLSSGIYFVQAIVPGELNEIRKVVLMK
ncbi:MAG: T9SS type A sorting domain-containing protein [Candidatus Electryonea clarkiae]|nr:T9SS type A sorting domain-containing protein [Candidatus Electryonea clarkiae]MDP8287806.1 T9SS type A sorting domain-containing protein [Candidatus Electryonea clarkiae]